MRSCVNVPNFLKTNVTMFIMCRVRVSLPYLYFLYFYLLYYKILFRKITLVENELIKHINKDKDHSTSMILFLLNNL